MKYGTAPSAWATIGVKPCSSARVQAQASLNLSKGCPWESKVDTILGYALSVRIARNISRNSSSVLTTRFI